MPTLKPELKTYIVQTQQAVEYTCRVHAENEQDARRCIDKGQYSYESKIVGDVKIMSVKEAINET